MAETRSQPPLKIVLTDETREILLSRLVKMKETYDDAFAQIREELHGLRLSLRSRNRKEENPEDQALNDKELVETEVATEPIEIEQGAVKNEANATMISAIDKEEPISQLQVPVSKLEPSLRFHNASPDVCEDFKSLVGLFDHVKARDVLLKKSGGVTNNQAAHYLFDKMSLRVQSKSRKIKCHKSWRFKFKERKQRRGKLRSAHKLIHRVDVMEDDHVYQEGLPLWLLVRFRFWKFKFINRKLQKVIREHGFANHLKLMYDKGEHDELFIMARTVNVRCLLGIMFGIIQSNAGYGQKPVYNQIIMVNERMFKYKKGSKYKGLGCVVEKKKLRNVEDGVKQDKNRLSGDVGAKIFMASEELHLLQDVFEMVKELLLKTSLVSPQVMRNTKLKFTKQWMFKFRKKKIDMVLGVQWLKTLGHISWDFKSLVMRFRYKKQKVLLNGINTGSVRDLKAQKLQKLQEGKMQLAMICVHEISEEEDREICTLNGISGEEGKDSMVEMIVEGFPDMFAEPSEVAYKLQLHPVFHVSQLKVLNVHTTTDLPTVLQDVFEKALERILERKRQGRAVTKILVQWLHEPEEEATWEFLFDIQKQYPDFVADNLEVKVL